MEFPGDIIISAIISTYNREKYIPGLLDNLLKQTLSNNRFEIIIVDNNCTDNTPEICRNFIESHKELNIKYIVEPMQGLSHARNCGINNSLAGLLTFVDDDALLSENFLEVCVEFFKNNPDADAIGGKILLNYEGEKPGWVTVYHESLFGYFNPGNDEKVFTRSKYPRGSNMTFRKSVFENFGLFNTGLGRSGKNMLGAEEKELFERIKGKVVYVPSAIVFHYVPVERTIKSFVKRQAIGIGRSEKIRTLTRSGPAYYKRILTEFIKWGATFILAVIYSATLNFSKAGMIIFLRYYITSGLLSGK